MGGDSPALKTFSVRVFLKAICDVWVELYENCVFFTVYCLLSMLLMPHRPEP